MMWIGFSGKAAAASGVPDANKSSAQAKDRNTKPNDVVKRDLTMPFPPFQNLMVDGGSDGHAAVAQ
ncbi:MAG: hypothetical protein V1800_17830 [Candidatus Latescibacterota bacterium]